MNKFLNIALMVLVLAAIAHTVSVVSDFDSLGAARVLLQISGQLK